MGWVPLCRASVSHRHCTAVSLVQYGPVTKLQRAVGVEMRCSRHADVVFFLRARVRVAVPAPQPPEPLSDHQPYQSEACTAFGGLGRPSLRLLRDHEPQQRPHEDGHQDIINRHCKRLEQARSTNHADKCSSLIKRRY